MMPTLRLRLLAGLALVGSLAALTCEGSVVDLEGTTLADGTWGGDDAGVLVDAERAHVHFGCTYGDFPAPIELDADGRFTVPGDYLLHAYPVAIGPSMPAQLAGVVHGIDLTVTIAVNDTIAKELVVLGPTTVQLGRDPKMQICPICSLDKLAPPLSK